jgi:hypothetical protein
MYSIPTGDFVTSTLSGALAQAATSATIGTGLTLPATNGVLHLNYDSTVAVGTDEGPETISYTAYNSGTGAITGLARGLAGTTDVAHANGSTVACGMSSLYLTAEAWTAFTPSWTNLTVGAGGTNTGAYVQIGKTVHFRTRFIFGSGSAVGTNPQITLPVTIKDYVTRSIIGSVMLEDNGTGTYTGVVLTDGTIYAHLTSGTYLQQAQMTASAPWTWTTNDSIETTGTYEAA